MLSELEVHASLPVQDLERAKRFYAERLGFIPFSETPGAVDYRCRDSWFSLFPSWGESTGEFTQAGWRTDDIEAVVADLKSRGVIFEEYDLPDFKTVESIVTIGQIRAAYFKDSEGNLLGIAQFS
jgi:catechol 2,3-dioxygenase-like lactoylglutathione lyase family enzyme